LGPCPVVALLATHRLLSCDASGIFRSSRREPASGFRESRATSSAADAKVSGICREMGTGEPGFRKAEIVRHDLPGTIKTIPFAAPSTAH
jgi:hypothetical protein